MPPVFQRQAGAAGDGGSQWLCLTNLGTDLPRIPRIASDAEQVNAAELDKPDPAQCNSPNQAKACCA